MKSSSQTSFNAINDKEAEFPNPEKCLLWKLSLKRKEAFEAMNNDVDEVVNQCLRARRHLQAIEDSNRNLNEEVRSLRKKYEALLEKNKYDTGIIMRLKDSESLLKQARKNQEDASEALLLMKMKNKEKLLERHLLRDNLANLLFQSQTDSNRLNKINLKHKGIFEMIEEENKRGKENENRLTQEIKDLRLKLSKDDDILEKWQKDNTERDAAIRDLQDDMKEGLMIKASEVQEEIESVQDSTNEGASVTDESEIEQLSKENVVEEKVDDGKPKPKNSSKKEKTVRREWLRKKILFEGADKQKEHWMDTFMLLNKRIQDINIEIVNVREWRIDKEVQKRELLLKAKELQQLVSQKRRKKPVPARAPMDELNICIQACRPSLKKELVCTKA